MQPLNTPSLKVLTDWYPIMFRYAAGKALKQAAWTLNLTLLLGLGRRGTVAQSANNAQGNYNSIMHILSTLCKCKLHE